MVELRFYTADTAVRFCHEVPNHATIAKMVYAPDWKSEDPGSIPGGGTNVASRWNSAGFSKGSATKDFVFTQLAVVV